MSWFSRVHGWLSESAEKRPLGLATIGGLLLGISFPPFPLPFIAFIAWLPFLYLWHYGKQKIALATYVGFLVWNVIVGYWLCLTVLGAKDLNEAFQNFLAGFLANTLNPILMSLPVLLFLRFVKKRFPDKIQIWVFFPAYWISFEYLHFHWELTWSWLTLGHAFASAPWCVQWIEFTGVYGISLWIWLVNIGLWLLLHGMGRKAFVGTLLTVVIPCILSGVLMWEGRSVFQPSGSVRLRIVQPNIDPYQKFEVSTEEEQIRLFLKMYEATGIENIDLVVFPETAIPFGIVEGEHLQDPRLMPLLEAIQRHKVPVLIGCSSYRLFHNAESAPPTARFNGRYWVQSYNAATLLGTESILFYHKAKLVPFVERTPYYEYLKGLEKVIQIDLGGGFGNYGLPDSIHCLTAHGVGRIGVVICYESIFGAHVREVVKKGAEWISVITNDGWWGNSSGYLQHAAYARLRAIETRREIIRSANTGLSQHIDNQGFLKKSTDWWKPEFTDVQVQFFTVQTFYVLYGDIIAYLCLAMALFLLVFFQIKKTKQ